MQFVIRTVASIAVACSLASSSFAQQNLFPSRVWSTPAQGAYSRQAAGDFNGDGRLDLVSVHDGGIGVVVHLQLPGGGFSDSSYFAGWNLGDLALGDVDGDLDLDIVILSRATWIPMAQGWVTVLRGNGAGSFVASPAFSVGYSPEMVAMRDWSGDGKLDLVIGSIPNPNAVQIQLYALIGNGLGGFSQHSSPGILWNASDLELADLDSDGKPELIAADSPDIRVYAGLGAAGFGGSTNYTAGSPVGDVAIEDLNGDSRLDLICTQSPSGIAVLIAAVGGGFLPAMISNQTKPSTGRISIADVDGDGKLDLGMASYANPSFERGGVELLKGDGIGGFVALSSFAAGPHPSGIKIGDFDGDGVRDLAVADLTGFGFTIVRGLGAGVFETTSDPALSEAGQVSAVGDLNGDSRPDIAVVQEGANRVSILFALPGGGYAAGPVIATGNSPTDGVLADFDFDGDLDLATCNRFSDDVHVFANNGLGSFAPLVVLATGGQPMALETGDFDHDGRMDLACAHYGANFVNVWKQQAGGGFSAPTPYSVSFFLAQELAAGDLDRDGWLDLLVCSSNGQILRGGPSGVFTAGGALNLGTCPEEIALGDLNGDQKLDLVVVSLCASLFRFMGNGGGGFGSAQQVSSELGRAVEIADVDGDGDADLLHGTYPYSALVVHVNNGAASFTREVYAVGSSPTAIVARNLDGDDRPEVLVTNSKSRDVTILRSTKPASALVYCTAKVSSAGCTPRIGFSGIASASSTSGFTVRAWPAMNNKPGLCLYSVTARAAVPFQGGVLCLGSPIRRSTGVSSGGSASGSNCTGVFSIDMNAFAHGTLGGLPLAALTVSGTLVRSQWWGRDPGFALPNNTTLSDALEYAVGP